MKKPFFPFQKKTFLSLVILIIIMISGTGLFFIAVSENGIQR